MCSSDLNEIGLGWVGVRGNEGKAGAKDDLVLKEGYDLNTWG